MVPMKTRTRRLILPAILQACLLIGACASGPAAPPQNTTAGQPETTHPQPSPTPSRSPNPPIAGRLRRTPPIAGKPKSHRETTVKTSSAVPELLQQIEKHYAQAATMTADFSQVTESTATHQKKTSTGVIMAKRPDKVRWETLKPDRNLLVSDGKTFWMYTPPFEEGERGQLIERKSSQVQSRLANALLSGSFSTVQDMKFQKLDDNRFAITPKPHTAGGVARIEITVDPKEKLIHQVVLLHKDGNRSDIRLSKIVLSKELGDDLFTFTPPANTDRITE
jgi:outer membrane lipoprotein carrier protein